MLGKKKKLIQYSALFGQSGVVGVLVIALDPFIDMQTGKDYCKLKINLVL